MVYSIDPTLQKLLDTSEVHRILRNQRIKVLFHFFVVDKPSLLIPAMSANQLNDRTQYDYEQDHRLQIN